MRRGGSEKRNHAEQCRSAGDGAYQLAHAAELGVAALEQFGDRLRGKLVEGAQKNGFEQLRGGFVIGVGAALGFGDDFIDDAEIAEVLGRDAQRLRGEFGLAGIAL